MRDVGVEVPSWEALAEGLCPEDVNTEPEPNQPKHGWQKFASVTIQILHRENVVWPTLSPAEQAMVRSQSGPLSVPFTAMPTSRVTRIASSRFGFSCCDASVLLCPLCSLLPVWPSPRRPWQPPRSLQHSWGAGEKAVRGRKRCGADLPGRRSPGVSKRNIAGPRHCSTAHRRTPLGGGCRRIDPVREMQLALDATVKKGRTPSCARATAVRVWWSLREK